jgi:hypothetical protein
MRDRTRNDNTKLKGYAVLNTDRNEFLSRLGSGPLGADEELFQSMEEAREHLESCAESGESHLEVVSVYNTDGIQH